MTNVGTRDGNEMRLKPVSTVLLMEFAGREGRPKEGLGSGSLGRGPPEDDCVSGRLSSDVWRQKRVNK